MASDLSTTPVTGLQVQLCGDAHLSNFGVYGSPERSLVFDLNDFDETLPGPWEWDVKRLAASFSIAARHNGYGSDDELDLPRRAAQAYRTAMHRFADMSYLDVWYAHLDVEQVFRAFSDRLTKKERKSRHQVRHDGPIEEQPPRLRQAGRAVRRRVPHRLATAADHPVAGNAAR